jgi:iron complex transport system substrate-binding protein
MKSNYLILALICFFFSCRNMNDATAGQDAILSGDTVYYAKGFHVETHSAYTLLTVRNPWKPERELQRFVLVPRADSLPDDLPEGALIRTPLERTVSFGAVQCSFFAELDVLHTIVGVCEPQYINLPYVRNGVREGKIADMGQAANPNIERIMLAAPEALFTAPVEEAGAEHISALGIPVVECVDYMEASPLSRAEWIRFFALFFEKRRAADSLFALTVSRYESLQALTAQCEPPRPTVFSETVYSGVWWLPGGNSYMARFFKDAGAAYIWADDTQTGSVGMPFEAVLAKAEKADFWLIKYNADSEMTLRELAEENPNYALFEAYKSGNIYVCNTGKTPYYEDLPVHPDYILEDMAHIFHPQALPDYVPRYFRKITEKNRVLRP